ncbi:translation initiation factor IF-2 [Desulfococcaceae bacterium HSG8]|nr:translation initiation factor IF-2 [Desulfococcaceae bacterium HSG8]
MAKIRVYELAKDLNMKSKALLEKLREMDITVGSHVSSLDKDTVTKIRASLFGKNPEKVEMTRIKSTVIRRPKKHVPEKSSHAKSLQKTESNSEAGPTEPSEITEQQSSAPPHEAAVKEETAEHNTAKDSDVTDKEDSEKVGMPAKKPSKEKAADASESAKPEPRKRSAVSDTERQSRPPKSIKSEKRRRKRKKETPARIIKLPTELEKREAEAAKAMTPATTQQHTKTANDSPAKTRTKPRGYVPKNESAPGAQKKEASAKDKKKRIRRRKPEPETDRKTASPDKKAKDIRWTKKKISFKRKEVVEGDALYDEGRRGRKGRKGGKVKVKAQKTQITTPKAIKRRIKIDDTIVLSDLAKRMGIKAGEMIKKLMMLGVMATVNQTIDFDTAALVASEFDYEVERASFEEEAILGDMTKEDDPEELKERSPVVTIMGHVDHGKTSLLDVIRKTRITELEAGGITQHIGAYNVSTNSGQITFLDTPGHEAFTSMRGRGAKITDLVVLVVAADDGVMPQTIEAINHSKAAGVPIIVAVNKIDKANAEPDRVFRELSDHGLVPEDWGGDTIFVKVSAKQNQGIDNLLEMILLQSEVLELKANPSKLALGYVVESKLDSGRGPVATVLVQDGTLDTGDPVVCGVHHGKIRAMLNDRGVQVESAGPAIPVEILGLSGVPNAGDELITLTDDKSAKQVSIHRVQRQRSKELAKTSRMSLEKLFEKMQEGEVKELNLIIKADVHGSIEALTDSLVKLSNEEVSIKVVHSATGTITESDVSLAAVSDAIIIGFNVRPTPKVQAIATEEHVDMRFYNVIYNVIKDVQGAILGMMESTYEERVVGRAEIREVFHVPKIGAIAGSYVTDGKMHRGNLARVLRDGVVCYEGKIGSLRRFKDDVKEVLNGYECGIGIENFNDIKVADVIECYYLEEIKPEL